MLLTKQDRLQYAYIFVWTVFSMLYAYDTSRSVLRYTDDGTKAILLNLLPKLVLDALVFLSVSLYMFILVHYRSTLKPPANVTYWPSVDVFLPRYKEPWLMFRDTVRAALSLDYPADKLRVIVCDDGGRLTGYSIYLNLVEEFDLECHPVLRYVRRNDGRDAKAGNLNNALKFATGEVVVVFDADHQCHASFLRRVVPHLLDPTGAFLSRDTAFAQVAQKFYNKNDLLVRMFNGSQLSFYNMVLPALSSKGVALCVGTGYAMQRRALDSIDGYVGGYAVEDVITALELFKKGWKGVYVESDDVIVEGLSPATVKEFFEQRFRWACGSAQLLLYRNLFRDCTAFQIVTMVAMNYYWLVMPVIFVLSVLRVLAWAAYGYVTRASFLSILLEWSPLGVIFVLPGIPFFDKVCQMMALFSYMPIYWKIITMWVHGSLQDARVKASSESFGDAFPKLALYNLVVPIVMTFVIAMLASQDRLDVMSAATFAAWTWFTNFPVWVGLFKTVRTGEDVLVERAMPFRGRQRRYKLVRSDTISMTDLVGWVQQSSFHAPRLPLSALPRLFLRVYRKKLSRIMPEPTPLV